MADTPDELSQTISLIRKARGGDAGAVESLFERYSRLAVDCAQRLAGPALRKKFDPEDLAQSALSEVWRDFRRFDYRGIGSLDRFVRHVVENKIRDKAEYLRAQRRDAALEKSLRAPSGEATDTTRTFDPPADDLSTTQVVSRRETEERVHRAIDHLAEEHAQPLRLFWIEGVSLKEIAEKLGLAGPDAARMRIQRARKELKKILGEAREE